MENGIETAGMENGIETAGMENGIETAGMENGIETAGMENGIETAGMENGIETAGMENGIQQIDINFRGTHYSSWFSLPMYLMTSLFLPRSSIPLVSFSRQVLDERRRK